MLIFFLSFLQKTVGWHIPTVFTYSSTRMILAALLSISLTVFLGPRFIQKLYALKIGQTIRSKEECPQLYELHGKKQDTPTMGGILLLFSIALSLVLFMDLSHSYTWLLFFSLFVLGGLGALDDYIKLKKKNAKGISPKKKLLVQVLLSSFLSLYLLGSPFTHWVSQNLHLKPPVIKEFLGKKTEKTAVSLSLQDFTQRLYMPFMKKPLLQVQGFFTIFVFLWILFIVTGSSNAVNLSDGLDGLAAGLLVLTTAVFALVAFLSSNYTIARYLNIAYIEGSEEIAIFLTAVAGASLGFLWYNGYPAQVFMGDTGSLALGGSLGVACVLLKREVLLGIVGGVFVMEALSVILQVVSYRYCNKKRIFLCAPLHHHFEYKGWPETKVVLRFWIVGLLLAILGIGSLKFQ